MTNTHSTRHWLEKTERAVDHCRESIDGWKADEDACDAESNSAITDLQYVIELLS